MPPSRIVGPFEVLEPLGAGGMGEVFRARDTRLNRFVAIKFLPDAASPSARERFQREALAIAALNHPNICTLHEAGEDTAHGGQPYLVMELLEGETLYARLARGRVALAQIAQWGAEIADALQAAHAKGILHRDLKPGNIFITARGAVKVLDFGLAQMAQSAVAAYDGSTVSQAVAPGMPPLTHPGTTLGTYAYMAPEQARGEATDARSDLFSLGVVLYEMAGGQPPFRGRTSADLTAAILMLNPPAPSTLRAEIPARLDDIIAQCLEKNPELRYQTAGDLRAALRRLSGSAASSASGAASVVGAPPAAAASAPGSTPPGSALAPASRRGWLWPLSAAIVVAAAAAGWWWLRPRPAAAPPQLAFRQLTLSGAVQDAAISPDGKFLAHVDATPQGTSLRLMSVANGSDTQIMPPAPGCCEYPTFSPDGSNIYFLENRVLKMVPVLGGEVRTIAQHVCSGAGLSPDGRQLAYIAPSPGGSESELMLADADGAGARVLSNPSPAGYDSDCWLAGPLQPAAPAWSPDGRSIAVESGGAGSDVTTQVMLVGAAGGHVRPLGPKFDLAASALAWLPDGRGLIMARPVGNSPSQLFELTYPAGQVVQLTHDLQGYTRASVAAAAGGAIVTVHGNPQYSIWWQAAPGAAFQPLPGGGADQDGADALAWTPQGALVTTHTVAGQDQLWLEGSAVPARQIPLNHLPAVLGSLTALAGGQLVFNGINTGESWHIYRASTAGGTPVNLATGLYAILPTLVDHDRAVAFEHLYGSGKVNHQRLWQVPLAGGTPREISPQELYVNFLLSTPDQQAVVADVVVPGNVAGGVMRLSVEGAPPAFIHPRANGASSGFTGPYALTPDGRALVSVMASGSVGNLWAAPLDGGPLVELTHFTDLAIAQYAFARDGRLALSRGSANSDAVLATGLGH